ncbi:DUF805 domain-containing protein [Flavobacterium sp.]|uniref:DUF805 domain-containing protein n=1 Tax=Flavobacterium sp. TaxID=239 RepID=UPI0012039956|nr:DUF805 domain-containing protein [Flavobacterium sp.]RZJ70291.1 MAG: DUF805 domain-containing protein [Flavobacterium sp.]
MFNAPFSFSGRITRTEYGLSLVIYVISYCVIAAFAQDDTLGALAGLAFLALFWFVLAQGAKRCHDVNNSGWMQLIPFYVLWLIFEDGTYGSNSYGASPKGIVLQTDFVTPSGFSTAKAAASAISESPSKVAKIPEDQHTTLEVENVNFSLIQDLLKKLRALELTHSLSYEFLGTTAKIAIRHKNTSQALLEHLYTISDGIEVVGVSNGLLKIKIK